MQNFYFTFGSSKQFPYQNGYIVVVAQNYRDAVATFREKHPDIHEKTLNCSDVYTEEEWDSRVGKYYTNEALKNILVSRKVRLSHPEEAKEIDRTVAFDNFASILYKMYALKPKEFQSQEEASFYTSLEDLKYRMEVFLDYQEYKEAIVLGLIPRIEEGEREQ